MYDYEQSVWCQQKMERNSTGLVSTVLARHGYGLAKALIGFKQRHKCRRNLTVSPYVMKGFGPAHPVAYPVYRESQLRLFVPRHYGLKQFGDPEAVRIGLGTPAPRLRFAGTLRPLQKKATDAFMSTLGPTLDAMPSVRHPHGGILALDVGLGKTVCALNLAARVGRKTLVVVHKEFLMHQWHERIKEFLPGARVGLIQQKKVDVDGKDIVLAMLQSLSVREYDPSVLSSFGMVIADECFPGTTPILTRAGVLPISTLYGKWKDHVADPSVHPCPPDVVSFNRTTGEFEMKPLTYAWRKCRRDLVTVTCSCFRMSCTPEHKVLTTRGYVAAHALLPGDLAIAKYNTGPGTLRIESVSPIHINPSPYVYDIEVGDNHNFVVAAKRTGGVGMVVSNCHHLSSETFSRALPKISARVTLGLSATPTRKDGLTKVFKWYLGDIVFKASRPSNDAVHKRAWAVRLDAEAAGYGAVKHTRIGNVNTAAMVNQIAAHTPRTAFIADLALAIVASDPMRQVMILSGRRRHLDDIHGAIIATVPPEERHGLASVGYYVGGMNQTDLKVSEECRVVLATYSMAAEGLDIKTLNSLILATPMSDVTQAVGRILRKENAACPPWVVDIVDDFSVFQRQATTRRRIVCKQGFVFTDVDMGGHTEWGSDIAQSILSMAPPVSDDDTVTSGKQRKRRNKKKKTTQATIDDLFD